MSQKQNQNIERKVWVILGLPFDAINMSSTVELLYSSVKNKMPCFISTPNLNFLIESQNDHAFRGSVINSNLNVVDGKPLIWLSRLLGIPIPERVAGSDLIEELIENRKGYKPLNVFFFGGENDVGEIACKKLNAKSSGLKCVGNLNPGFGSIEDMSSVDIIGKINQCNADFVIVSLGAKKGQAWIEKNRKKIDAPIISHLGAVVNFIAGTVNRAPKFMQKTGLEWLWRIKEEPLLWKRYFNDGLSFINLLMFRVAPLFIIISFFQNRRKKNKPTLNISNKSNFVNIEISGYWSIDNISKVKQKLNDVINSHVADKVEINIRKNTYVDSALMAEFLLFENKLSDNKRDLLIKSESKLVTKIFKYNCCEYLLNQ